MSIARHRELLVLSTLHAHPMHGYALVEVLEAGLGRALALKRPAVYAILKRLEGRDWIAGATEREGRYPERSVYEVTAAGVAALPGLTLACARGGSATMLPLTAVLAQLDELSEADRRAVLDALVKGRRADREALAPLADHPGAGGAGIALQLRHLDAELELLSSIYRPGQTLSPPRER